MPPMIENGLNLPASGGWPVVIDGELYYYAVKYNGRGDLYEYWFNSNGDLVRVRHHSQHSDSGIHKNPHDHKGYRDEDGSNTESKKSEEVDERFQAPKQSSLELPSKEKTLEEKFQINEPFSSHSFDLGFSFDHAAGGVIIAFALVGGYAAGVFLRQCCF